jgi:hypothetical protein
MGADLARCIVKDVAWNGTTGLISAVTGHAGRARPGPLPARPAGRRPAKEKLVKYMIMINGSQQDYDGMAVAPGLGAAQAGVRPAARRSGRSGSGIMSGNAAV